MISTNHILNSRFHIITNTLKGIEADIEVSIYRED